MALIHKTKKEKGKKHKKKKKTQKKQKIFRIKLRNDRFKMFGLHSKPISAISAWFKSDFGLFRLPANMNQFGWYNPILAESTRFGANQAKSAQIWEKKKKKKSSDVARRMPHPTSGHIKLWCSTLLAASVLQRLLVLGHTWNHPCKLLYRWYMVVFVNCQM